MLKTTLVVSATLKVSSLLLLTISSTMSSSSYLVEFIIKKLHVTMAPLGNGGLGDNPIIIQGQGGSPAAGAIQSVLPHSEEQHS